MTCEDRHFEHLDPAAMRPPAGLFAGVRHFCHALIIVGAIGCVFGWAMNPAQFHFAYLASWLSVWAVVMGVLFFVLLHYIVDAGWSTVVRRPAEQLLACLPVLTLLFIPILIGVIGGKTHQWVGPQGTELSAPLAGAPAATAAHETPADASHAENTPTASVSTVEKKARDAELLAHKRPYLNIPFFLARQIIYFSIWLLLAWRLRHNSLLQDTTGHGGFTLSSRRWSCFGMVLYALSVTFAAFDWIMTLQWQWFSTIFGVYTWAGAVCAGLAAISLVTLVLARGPLRQYVGSDTIHTLGELLFAFCVFWGYMAFSQYFLIWYGNLPEETVWFLWRWHGISEGSHSTWWIVTLLLPVGRFALPFLILMSAHTKRNPRVLTTLCIITLVCAWLDMYWMVMPAHAPAGAPLTWLWIDVSALALILGLCGAFALRALRSAPLLPIMDPRLVEALSGEHVEEIAAADVE